VKEKTLAHRKSTAYKTSDEVNKALILIFESRSALQSLVCFTADLLALLCRYLGLV
jgi:hypothetical protein